MSLCDYKNVVLYLYVWFTLFSPLVSSPVQNDGVLSLVPSETVVYTMSKKRFHKNKKKNYNLSF